MTIISAEKLTKEQGIGLAALLLAFLIGAALFAYSFEHAPTEGTRLGIDNILVYMTDWDLVYGIRDGVRNPPWSVLVMIPIGSLFTPKAGWGILVFLTLIVLVASVPQTRPRWLYWCSVLLLVTAYPALRTFADAQQEGLVIAGELLLLAGYARRNPLLLAGGLLLATAKPQASLLLLIVTGVYVLQTWPPRTWLTAGALTAAVVVPTLLWRGRDWLAAVENTYQRGQLIDISLTAALNRATDLPAVVVALAVIAVAVITLAAAWFSDRTLSRDKAGLVIAGSMLVAPYVAGNSMLNILAISIIPLIVARQRIGWLLLAMVNSMFLWIIFFDLDFRQDHESYWWTGVLLFTWAVLLWRVWRAEIAPRLLNTPTHD